SRTWLDRPDRASQKDARTTQPAAQLFFRCTVKVGEASVPRLSPCNETLAWLYGLQRFGIKLGLENIQRLIAALQVELGDSRVIHVAGTNGKGSVCAMIDSICRAGKYRSGLFISPHLVTFRERIRVNGEMISEKAVAAGLTTIRNLVASWDPHPTFFEITTALALKHFADAKPARRSLGEGGID